MKKIRQGQTRWRVGVEYNKLTGRPAVGWVEQYMVSSVNRYVVRMVTHHGLEVSISHGSWMRMHATFRKAQRAMLKLIEQANAEIKAEYAAAWRGEW